MSQLRSGGRDPRLRCLSFVLAFLLTAAEPPGAAAQPDAEATPQTVTIGNTGELVVLVRGLIAAGEYDAARHVIKTWRPSDSTYGYRVRYVEGLIAKARQDYPAAIAVFRSILAERPDFTFVRLDLTETLYLAKEDAAAKYQAELLIASGLDEQIGGGLRSIVGAIDDRRPIRFRGFGSLLPSSNVNDGTDVECVQLPGLGCATIGEESRRKSGVGVMLGGEMLLRHPLPYDFALIGSASLVGRYWPTIDRLDLAGTGTAGVERRLERGSIAVSAVAEQGYVDMEADFWGAGGRIDASHYVGETGRVFGRLSLQHRDYEGGDQRDGWRAEFSGFYDHFLEPTRFFRILGGLARENARSEAFSSSEWSAGLGIYTELPRGVSLYAQTLYTLRDFDGLFAGLGIVREDDRIDAEVTATKRDWVIHGFAPQITYSFTDNASNIPFYDYTSHGVDLRIVKQF